MHTDKVLHLSKILLADSLANPFQRKIEKIFRFVQKLRSTPSPCSYFIDKKKLSDNTFDLSNFVYVVCERDVYDALLQIRGPHDSAARSKAPLAGYVASAV